MGQALLPKPWDGTEGQNHSPTLGNLCLQGGSAEKSVGLKRILAVLVAGAIPA